MVKKILFLVSSMQGGGAERVAALMSNYWAEQGHQVTLMPTFSGHGECHYFLDERITLDCLSDRAGSISRSPWNKLRRLILLRQAIKTLTPDVVVSFLTHVNVAAIIATRGLNVPVIVSERTYPPAMSLSIILEILRKWTYPKADAVVVQTVQAMNWLRECCPSANGRLIANPVVYPLPSSEPELNPIAIVGGKKKLVLAVGRLGEEKGFAGLITAFHSLAMENPNWDLVILGEGPERDRLERLRNNLNIESRVYLPGRAGNLTDWYEHADIFVMSSRFEGFPNALAEAMAHGLPSVSYDCDAGPRDLIRPAFDGILVPPSEGEAGLSRAIESLIKNEANRHAMAKEAKTVRNRFSIERIAIEWDAILNLDDTLLLKDAI